METTNVPKKFQNEDGTLNSDAMIKSYSELEKKIGSMISVPGDDCDDESRAKFYRAIGVPEDANEYPTNEMFDDESIRTRFRDMGLTKSQVEKIYAVADEFLSPLISDVFNAKHTMGAMSELEKTFGGREKTIDTLRAINDFGEKYLPKDAFESLCTTPQGIQSIHKMMQSVEPSVDVGNNVQKTLTDNDLKMMMRDPKYWRDNDTEYIRKIENGFKKLYG